VSKLIAGIRKPDESLKVVPLSRAIFESVGIELTKTKEEENRRASET
jgi:hypothetical protein